MAEEGPGGLEGLVMTQARAMAFWALPQLPQRALQVTNARMWLLSFILQFIVRVGYLWRGT